MSTCKNCENLREHLRAFGKEIKRLRAKLRKAKPAGKVLATGYLGLKHAKMVLCKEPPGPRCMDLCGGNVNCVDAKDCRRVEVRVAKGGGK